MPNSATIAGIHLPVLLITIRTRSTEEKKTVETPTVEQDSYAISFLEV